MLGKNIIGVFAIFLFGALQAHAATLYMDPSSAELSRGDTIKVSVRLDTEENECINVVDAVIHYSDSIQPIDVSRGSSILSMWVEDPIINKKNHTITFAGGIPNGYCGRIPGDPRLTNVVADLLFQSPGFVIGAADDTNKASAIFDAQTQVLRNDGLGTRAPLNLYGITFTLSKTPGPSVINEWKDIVRADIINPEKFSITLEQTTNAYSNDWFITFNTTDKQSGIDHYEVIEESMNKAGLFQWGREDAPWREVKSPYVLRDQSLNHTIRVRAIDKSGNEYIAILVPPEAQRTMDTQAKILIVAISIALGIFFIAGFTYAYISLRHKKQKCNTLVKNEL